MVIRRTCKPNCLIVENSIDISVDPASKELLIASLTSSSGLVKSPAISKNSRTASTFGVIVNSFDIHRPLIFLDRLAQVSVARSLQLR